MGASRSKRRKVYCPLGNDKPRYVLHPVRQRSKIQGVLSLDGIDPLSVTKSKGNARLPINIKRSSKTDLNLLNKVFSIP